MSDLSSQSKQIQALLDSLGLNILVKEFEYSTRTAAEAAEAIGCRVGQIVKSLIFETVVSHQPVLVLVSGTNRVNEIKLEKTVGEQVEKADADFVREKTGFVIGGVPPVGHKEEMQTYIDKDLMQYRQVWAAAGHPKSIFPIEPRELERITRGKIIMVV